MDARRKAEPKPPPRRASPPRSAPPPPAPSPRGATFYLHLSASQLKGYLQENGVRCNDVFEIGDLRRRAWECYCDSLSGVELTKCMTELGVDGSGCHDVASRRQKAKQTGFHAESRPVEPVAFERMFHRGARVVLRNLTRAAMNGKEGVVVESASVPGRATVRIDGQEYKIKFENLAACVSDEYLD